MKTRIIQIDPQRFDDDWYQPITQVLLADGVMAYPTETFYGLGAVCFSKKAARNIYRLKKRDRSKPLSLVVSDLEMVAAIASEPPPAFYWLAEEFWPGPLTIVLKAAPSFPAERTGPGHTLALRIPPLPWLRRLIEEVGFPLIATSANVAGRREASCAADVIEMFNGKVDLIVDGGATAGTQPSTIVDISGGKLRLIRDGAIPFAKLEKLIHPSSSAPTGRWLRSIK